LYGLLKVIDSYRLKKTLAKAYNALAKLQQAFFNSYLTQESLPNQYKQIHKKTLRFFHALQSMRNITKKNDELSRVESIYGILCSLHLLRFRFNQPALLEVCAQEMKKLQEISVIFLRKQSNKKTSLKVEADNFLSAIYAFETVCNHTLSIVIPDSLMLDYFTQELYALHCLLAND
jgi:hypothetical protein